VGKVSHQLLKTDFPEPLSVPEGHVDGTWNLIGDRGQRIRLIWRERGGPPVKPPHAEGFGTRLIQNILRAELGDAPSKCASNRRA